MVGHSSGGYGALHMAYALPEYFSKLVVLSGASVGDRINKIKIPTRGYTENAGAHHYFMSNGFVDVFGEDSLTVYNAGHGDIPRLSFTEDLDGNNRSDLVEWMFDVQYQSQ
jgi:pimeloyl-ACP methyl ester carboxylesterase